MNTEQRPRIGLDVTSAITQGGGIGRYTRELVRALVKAGTEYEYRFFSARQRSQPPMPGLVPSSSNTTYHQALLSERWLYRLWYRLRLPIPVQWTTGKLDLFHSPDFVLPPVAGNIPTLLTVHDLSFIHHPEAFTPALVSYLSKVVPWSVGRASHILADSWSTRNDLLNIWDVNPEEVTVLYSGVDHMFRPMTDQSKLKHARQKYGLGDSPYLISVGTLQPRKNYQMLIGAFKPVANRLPHNLIIAGGKGWLYDEILASVAANGLTGRVHFVGFVDDADLPALYSDAALFVFPSLYEGFGLPLLEAMACGVPVLSSNASCLPEIAGDAAILLSPHNEADWTREINQLLTDPSRRTQLVASGFRRARDFSWNKAASQLLGVYRRLLGA